MNILTKTMIAAAGAVVMAMAPATAHAERVYFLVGTRHIFRIGPSRDINLEQRIEIEKSYADGVAADRDTFQKNLDSGADREKESDLLNEDLDRLADERDNALGAMFERVDGMRERHPELRIDGDGPYQVMGIDFHYRNDVEVFERFVVYAPWPGYVIVDRPYGGWVWGIEYGPTVFFNLYFGWHDHYYHGERFVGGFYGHRGPVHFQPHGFIDRHTSVIRGTEHGSVRTGGYGGRNNTYTHSDHSGGYGRGTTTNGSGHTGGYGHSTGTTGRGGSTGTSGTGGRGTGTSGYGGYGRGRGGDSTGSSDGHTTRSGGAGSIGSGASTGGYGRGRGGDSSSGNGTGTHTTRSDSNGSFGSGSSTSGTRTGGYGTHSGRSEGTGTFGSGRSTGSGRSGGSSTGSSDKSTGGRSSGGGSSEGRHSGCGGSSSSHDSKSTDKKKGGN